jgi:hypothetical protein
MSQYRSIIDTHNEMLKVIPEYQKQLIFDLIEFIKNLETNSNNRVTNTKMFTKKHIYSDYLRVMLKYIPNRPLKLSDPDWMWNCQEVFSNSTIN